jgi:hypothetical protein
LQRKAAPSYFKLMLTKAIAASKAAAKRRRAGARHASRMQAARQLLEA